MTSVLGYTDSGPQKKVGQEGCLKSDSGEAIRPIPSSRREFSPWPCQLVLKVHRVLIVFLSGINN